MGKSSSCVRPRSLSRRAASTTNHHQPVEDGNNAIPLSANCVQKTPTSSRAAAGKSTIEPFASVRPLLVVVADCDYWKGINSRAARHNHQQRRDEKTDFLKTAFRMTQEEEARRSKANATKMQPSDQRTVGNKWLFSFPASVLMNRCSARKFKWVCGTQEGRICQVQSPFNKSIKIISSLPIYMMSVTDGRSRQSSILRPLLVKWRNSIRGSWTLSRKRL